MAHFERMIPTEFDLGSDRGQVGIGTLIIFIAMVLVAAVAAGVLINTSGFLEAQASDTADDTRSQVSNRVRFVSATGAVNQSSDDGVNNITLTVMKAAGADAIAVDDASMQFVSDQATATLNTSSDAVNTSLVQAGETADPDVLDDKEDRLQITIDMTDSSVLGGELKEGSSATIRFIDQSGATSIYGVNVPDTITSDQEQITV